MNPFAIVLFWALMGLLLIQLPFLTNFISVVQKHLSATKTAADRFDTAGTGEAFLPKAAVILYGQWEAFVAIASGLALYGIGSLSIIRVLEHYVRKVLKTHDGEMLAPFSLPKLLQIMVAIPLMQFIYPIALYSVMLMRNVNWRGIRHEVHSPWDIRFSIG